MEDNILGTKFITQVAIVVENIEKTSQEYADFFGLRKPPIKITDVVEKAETEYRGKKSPARAKLAFFEMGSIQLELIEPDENQSIWREFLDEKGEGFHHIAFVVDGMKEKVKIMEKKGMPLIQKGEYTGGRYAYMDTQADLKVLFELLEND
ncbi:VOC family protein [Gracilibacillus sp. YIM 98692]|uniref:VOC family protein n=1 Tax=Gracilibacillus sp. YIM 98692 TaxID=2663532 RepID=UPI0013D8DCA1|nr:VOC family protein [Gracilibacillus sp. YIM 98692]